MIYAVSTVPATGVCLARLNLISISKQGFFSGQTRHPGRLCGLGRHSGC